MLYGAVAVYWVTGVTQVEIVQRTRAPVGAGRTLEEINKQFHLKEGKYPPNSLQYANELGIGNQPRAWLEEAFCGVFVKFSLSN
jgi:hypothetical protein